MSVGKFPIKKIKKKTSRVPPSVMLQNAKYNPDNQAMLLTTPGKSGRKRVSRNGTYMRTHTHTDCGDTLSRQIVIQVTQSQRADQLSGCVSHLCSQTFPQKAKQWTPVFEMRRENESDPLTQEPAAAAALKPARSDVHPGPYITLLHTRSCTLKAKCTGMPCM